MAGAGAALALVLAGAGPATAEIVPWKAEMSGKAEVPPNDSAGTGQFEGSFDTENRTLTYTITYSGLTGPITAAHVHGPAIPGKTAPIMLPIVNTAESPIKGTATLSPEQADTLKRGVYVNIHTAAHPDGELRGELK
jgi:hypothetical protein